jgi:hypothetical protein
MIAHLLRPLVPWRRNWQTTEPGAIAPDGKAKLVFTQPEGANPVAWRCGMPLIGSMKGYYLWVMRLSCIMMCVRCCHPNIFHFIFWILLNIIIVDDPCGTLYASIIRGSLWWNKWWIRVVKVSSGLDLGDQASRLALLLYDKDASHVNLLFLESWTCRQMDS